METREIPSGNAPEKTDRGRAAQTAEDVSESQLVPRPAHKSLRRTQFLADDTPTCRSSPILHIHSIYHLVNLSCSPIIRGQMTGQRFDYVEDVPMKSQMLLEGCLKNFQEAFSAGKRSMYIVTMGLPLKRIEAGHQELSPSEVKELLEAFYLFDKDNDGVISSGELRAVLAALGYPENDKDAGDILKKADLNGDGVLTFPEYERLIRDHVMPLQVMEKQARDIFRTFDKGKKGFMDDQDFRRFLIAHGQKSTEEAMYGRFESLDKMGSGRLSVKDVTPTIRQILFES